MQYNTYYPVIDHSVRQRGNASVRELIQLRQPRLRKSTRKSNLSLIAHIEAYSHHGIGIRSIDTDFCRGFAKYLLEHVKANSARTYLQKLHAILQDAVRMGYLRSNPMPPIAELLPRYVSPERPFLTLQEIQLLENTSCPHDSTKQAFLFSCHTGLRLSDIETLCWDDLKYFNGRAMVVKIQVKTGREVRIPVDMVGQEILAQRKLAPSMDGRVFQLLSRTIISKDLRQWSHNASLGKHLTFHVARHTFATLMISQGISIYAVSQLCGHTNVKTTEIYASLIDSARFMAIESLNTLFVNRENTLS